MSYSLRSYQREAVDSVFSYFGKGRTGNPLVVLPTGSGKSLVAAALIAEVLTKTPYVKFLSVTHRKELLHQNESTLNRLAPHISTGMYSSGAKRKEVGYQVTFAGIQSVYTKADLFQDTRIILVDECHLLPKEGNGMYLKFLADLWKYNSKIKVIGFTATPYRADSGLLTHGSDAIFTSVVYNADIKDLIAQGYLAPLTTRPTSATIDLTDVSVRMGEYVSDELAEAADKEAITDAMVDDLDRDCKDRKSILVFCTSVQHAHNVRNTLRMRGYQSEVVTGETPRDERNAILQSFKRGELRTLVNVDVLCLDEETEILTSEGWVGIDEMTMQHRVANWKDGEIFFSEPKFLVRRQRFPGEKMVVLKTRKMSVRVTSNHRMLYRTFSQGKFLIESAEKLVGRKLMLPVSGQAAPFKIMVQQEERLNSKKFDRAICANSYVLRKQGHSATEARGLAISRLRRKQQLFYKNPNELTIDECRFIGFWLGDGTVVSVGVREKRYSATQANAYPKIIEWFDGVVERCQIDHCKTRHKNKNSGAVRWNFSKGTGSGPQTRNGIFHLIPYLKKGGSYLLWGLTETQFDAVIEGLWYADGLHGDGAKISKGKLISSTNHSFLNLLQAIAVCRGYRARVITGKSRSNDKHSILYKINLTKATIHHVTINNSFRFDEGWLSERCWCVTSDTGNIITRRDGIVCVTGNTTGFDSPNIDCLVCLRPTKSTGLWVQQVGRGSRICDGKKNCVILDYGGNIDRHGPIDQIKPRIKEPKDKPGEAPMKTCLNCLAQCHAGMKFCPECGHAFPDPNHGLRMQYSSGAILSNQVGPTDTFKVDDVVYKRWQKVGKPPTLRVDYQCGFNTISEWIGLGHTGWFGEQAYRWWEKREIGVGFVPLSVDAAVEQAKYLRKPQYIKAHREGQFWRIDAYLFAKKEDDKCLDGQLPSDMVTLNTPTR